MVGSPLFPLLGLRLVADRERRGDTTILQGISRSTLFSVRLRRNLIGPPCNNGVQPTHVLSVWLLAGGVSLESGNDYQFCVAVMERKDELLLSQIDLSPRTKFLTFLPRKLDTAMLEEAR